MNRGSLDCESLDVYHGIAQPWSNVPKLTSTWNLPIRPSRCNLTRLEYWQKKIGTLEIGFENQEANLICLKQKKKRYTYTSV